MKKSCRKTVRTLQKKCAMIKFLSKLTGVVCLLLSGLPVIGQLELSFQTTLESTNEYCATVMIHSGVEEDIKIGTSSFFIEYNKEALKFRSYTSQSFDGNLKCISDEDSPYTHHNYDASYAGVINATIFLKDPNHACPEIGKDDTEIATICFDILDKEKESGLMFNEEHTNIDKASLKVELFDNLVLKTKNEPLSR